MLTLSIGLPGSRCRAGDAAGRPLLFAAVDANKDGVVTRAEMQAAFSGWFAAWDRGKAGALTQAAIAAGLGSVLRDSVRWPAAPRVGRLVRPTCRRC